MSIEFMFGFLLGLLVSLGFISVICLFINNTNDEEEGDWWDEYFKRKEQQ